jgi:hypothetical protein
LLRSAWWEGKGKVESEIGNPKRKSFGAGTFPF